MLGVYGLYLTQAIVRNHKPGSAVQWPQQEVWMSVSGVLSLAIGAYLTVTATEQIVSILGISPLVGRLFITSTLSIAPEVFATWSIARSGQVTAATTSHALAPVQISAELIKEQTRLIIVNTAYSRHSAIIRKPVASKSFYETHKCLIKSHKKSFESHD